MPRSDSQTDHDAVPQQAADTLVRCDNPGATDDFDNTGEELLAQAIATVLLAPAHERAERFEHLTREIVLATNAPESGLRPWKCSVHDGTDGSRIFRSGIGVALVIDGDGRLWRGRSIEDFHTTYIITATSCEIDTLTPDYNRMREYLPR